MQFNSTKYYALLLCCLTTTYSLFAKDALLSDVQHNLSHNNMGFIENKGQVVNQYSQARTDIQYNLKKSGISLFLSPASLHYQFNNVTTNGNSVANDAYRMDVTLVGGNLNAKARTENEQEYTEHYTVKGKAVTAKSFNKIIYQDVYPGIDWAVYVQGDKVEYDFIVHPGADAAMIKLKYEGATNLNLAANGKLIIKTPAGEITEHSPFTYALNDNREIASSFSLNHNILSFNVGKHDGTIVIDPQLQWSTYYGGTNAELLNYVATDAAGNVYACGYTNSTSNIATAGAYQTAYNANNDAFLVKYNASGTVAWSTYFGGAGSENAFGVAVDRNGNVYMCGSTSSNTLFTAGAAQTVYGGGGDAFLAKFNSAGTIQFSTYLGGNGSDIAYAVTCDKWRSVYVTGQTASNSGVSTLGSFNATYNTYSNNASAEGFLVRYDTSGNKIWGTYYGGSFFSSTTPQGVSVDPAGYVYFIGYTNSNAGISTATSYQPTYNGSFGSYNAFVAKFDSNDNRVWGSYYGGSNSYGSSAANDTLGNLYIGGYTQAANNIASTGSYQPTIGGSVDGYLAKFDTSGSFKWGTYYGGTGSETQKGLTIDNFGNPMIAGYTTSTTNIATTINGTYQSVFGGLQDGYIAKFTPFGQRMWGTYFGGVSSETQGNIANNANGGFYSCGNTNSVNAISTAGSAQPNLAGNTDGYISRFNKDTFVVISQPYIDTFVCPAGSYNVTYNTSYSFNAGNIFTAQLSDATGSFAAPVAIGSVSAVGTNGIIPVTIPAGTATGNNYRIRIVATSPAYTSPDEFVNIHVIGGISQPSIASNSPVCIGDSIKLSAVNTSLVVPTTLTITGPNSFSSGASGYVSFATAINAGTYTATVSHNGCPAATNSVNVAVNSVIPPTPSATSNSPICAGSSLIINASSTVSPVTYRVTGPHGYLSSSQNPVISNIDTSMGGFYYIIDTLNGCRSAKDSILITVTQSVTATLNVTVNPGNTICVGQGFSFNANATNGGNNPQYQWRVVGALGDSAVVGATSNIYSSAYLSSGNIVYCILHSNAQCLYNPSDTSNKITVTILQPSTPVVSITVSPSSSVALGTAQTFTSSVTSGGAYTSYQWFVNGHAVANDTFSTVTFHALADSDVVTVVVHNHQLCANPDSAISNAIRVHISNGLSNIETKLNSVVLYPNPNKGTLAITGRLEGLASNNVEIEILNAIGQLVHSNIATVVNGNLNVPIALGSIADGTYLLRIKADGESRVIKFNIER